MSAMAALHGMLACCSRACGARGRRGTDEQIRCVACRKRLHASGHASAHLALCKLANRSRHVRDELIAQLLLEARLADLLAAR